MLIDDLKQELKSIEPDIETIITFCKNAQLEQKVHELRTVSNQEGFWQHPEQAKILKQLQQLQLQYDQLLHIKATKTELEDLVTLFSEEEHELQKLVADIKELKRTIIKFKISLLMSGPDDQSNCFLNINAGAGGTESQDWANMLLRMYIRFCERENFNVAVVDYQDGEEAGIKSATLFIKGKNAYGLLKGEAGIHRLVRISPFDANKRRHTSFAAVDITPEVEEVAIVINPSDLRIDTYRAGGAGGQHVNKTDSAVRITHEPTGIVTQCQSERSQTQNKATAMKMLAAKLAERQKEAEASKLAAIEKKKIEWGSQIRSYVLHPYKMIKDHRTNVESPQPEIILDGDLMEFIEQYLIYSHH